MWKGSFPLLHAYQSLNKCQNCKWARKWALIDSLWVPVTPLNTETSAVMAHQECSLKVLGMADAFLTRPSSLPCMCPTWLPPLFLPLSGWEEIVLRRPFLFYISQSHLWNSSPRPSGPNKKRLSPGRRPSKAAAAGWMRKEGTSAQSSRKGFSRQFFATLQGSTEAAH